MAQKFSKGRVSRCLDPDEEEKKAKRKALEGLELRKLTREAKMKKEVKLSAGRQPQMKVKNILSKENISLQENLKLVKNRRRCILDAKKVQDITNLFAQGDDLDAAIAQEKKYIEDLESEIHKDSQNIHSLPKNKGNVVATSDYLVKKENERADRSLESWKSKLAAEQKKLALTIKNNEEMRRKLEHLLNEKAHFNKIFEELMGKLTKGKKVMADVAEQSRLEFQKRDEISRKIDALRTRDKADLGKRMEEMQELEIKLFEDEQLTAYRNRIQLMRQKLEEEMRRTHETADLEKLTMRLEKTTAFWDKLKEVTGLSQAEEICRLVKKNDAELFSLFNFNNEVRDQLEVLTHKTAELVRNVNDEYAMTEHIIEENQKKTQLMKRKLSVLEQGHIDFTEHCDANARLFSRLLNKVKTLLEMMQCETSTLEDLLGNNMEVTEFNYRLYLSLIETKVIAYLQLMAPTTAPPRVSVSLPTPSIGARSTRVNKFKSKPKSTVSGSAISRVIVTRACRECDGATRTILTKI